MGVGDREVSRKGGMGQLNLNRRSWFPNSHGNEGEMVQYCDLYGQLVVSSSIGCK